MVLVSAHGDSSKNSSGLWNRLPARGARKNQHPELPRLATEVLPVSEVKCVTAAPEVFILAQEPKHQDDTLHGRVHTVPQG